MITRHLPSFPDARIHRGGLCNHTDVAPTAKQWLLLRDLLLEIRRQWTDSKLYPASCVDRHEWLDGLVRYEAGEATAPRLVSKLVKKAATACCGADYDHRVRTEDGGLTVILTNIKTDDWLRYRFCPRKSLGISWKAGPDSALWELVAEHILPLAEQSDEFSAGPLVSTTLLSWQQVLSNPPELPADDLSVAFDQWHRIAIEDFEEAINVAKASLSNQVYLEGGYTC